MHYKEGSPNRYVTSSSNFSPFSVFPPQPRNPHCRMVATDRKLGPIERPVLRLGKSGRPQRASLLYQVSISAICNKWPKSGSNSYESYESCLTLDISRFLHQPSEQNHHLRGTGALPLQWVATGTASGGSASESHAGLRLRGRKRETCDCAVRDRGRTKCK